jgi:hypothetical protein
VLALFRLPNLGVLIIVMLSTSGMSYDWKINTAVRAECIVVRVKYTDGRHITVWDIDVCTFIGVYIYKYTSV